MNDRINKVVPGTGIRASWGNDVIDQLRRLKIIPGNGIKVSTSSKGTVIALKDEGSKGPNKGDTVMSDVMPCTIRAAGEDELVGGMQGFPVTLYPNGFFDARNTEDGKLYLPEVTTHTQLPVGTSILAHVCPCNYTQSDEPGDNNGGQ